MKRLPSAPVGISKRRLVKYTVAVELIDLQLGMVSFYGSRLTSDRVIFHHYLHVCKAYLPFVYLHLQPPGIRRWLWKTKNHTPWHKRRRWHCLTLRRRGAL
jgi:hypothetical protein